MMSGNRIFILILLLIFVTSFSSRAETLHWDYSCQATPFDIQASIDGQTILAKFGMASVWITDNGGADWVCLDRALKSVHNATYETVTPYLTTPNGDGIVAICSENSSDPHVLYSANGTDSFEDRTPISWEDDASIANFAIDPNSEGSWLIQTRYLCFYTCNAGLSWNCVPSVPSDMNIMIGMDIFCDPFIANRYYNTVQYLIVEGETVTSGYNIYRSQNGPYNWEIETPFIDLSESLGYTRTYASDLIPLSNGNLLVLVSGDSGDEEEISRYAVFNSDGELLSLSGDEVEVGRVFGESSQNPGRLCAYTNSGFYLSTDYGISWEFMSSSHLPDIEDRCINHIGSNIDNSIIYCCIDHSGIYSSLDFGGTWSVINTFDHPLHRRVYSESQNLFYYGDGDGWDHRPTGSDDLITLQLPEHPDSIYNYGTIAYANGDTLLGTVRVRHPDETGIPNTRLYRTEDNGSSWYFAHDLNEWYYHERYYNFESLSCSGRYLVNCQLDYIEYSDDAGETWTMLAHPFPESPSTLTLLISHYNDKIYALIENIATTNYDIVKYDFETSQWIDTNYPNTRCHTSAMIAKPDGLMIIEDDCEVELYNNSSWTTLPDIPYGGWLTSISAEYIPGPSPLYICFARYHDKIFAMKENWEQWYELEFDHPYGINLTSINCITYDPVRERVWLETSFGLLWFPVEYALKAQEKPIQLFPADSKLLTNYPNPFNTSTRIQYHLSKPGNVKLDIYDITGRWVETLKNTYQPSGVQSVFLDGSVLSSGTYFIQLNTGTEIQNRKITLVK